MNFRGKRDYLSERRLHASLATNSCRTNFATHWKKLKLGVDGQGACCRLPWEGRRRPRPLCNRSPWKNMLHLSCQLSRSHFHLFGIVKIYPCLNIFRSQYIHTLFGIVKTCPSPSIFRSQQCASPQASLHHRSRSSWEKMKVNPKKVAADFIELKGWASNTIYPGRSWNWITLRLARAVVIPVALEITWTFSRGLSSTLGPSL